MIGNGIQLHTDFLVDLAREDEFLRAFRDEFLPNIRGTPGFIDAKLLKLRRANVGDQPTALNYRLAQTFESEELREAWTVAPGHARAWPPLEQPLKLPEGTTWLFTALLFDIA